MEQRDNVVDYDEEFHIEEFRSSAELRVAMAQWRSIGMEVNNNNNNDNNIDDDDDSDDESVASSNDNHHNNDRNNDDDDVCTQTALNSHDSKDDGNTTCVKSVISWIQCDRVECKKWRKVDIDDVSQEVSEGSWNCTMNTDTQRNDCYFSQEEYSEDDDDDDDDDGGGNGEDESVYTKYIPGEVVLGRMQGYPWWPCIVEDDPDFDSFFYVEQKKNGDSVMSFHVTFFGKGASRAWITEDMLQDFTGRETKEDVEKLHVCRKSYTKDLAEALNDARGSLKLPLQRRVAKFGFLRRYTGSKLAEKHKQNVNGCSGSGCSGSGCSGCSGCSGSSCSTNNVNRYRYRLGGGAKLTSIKKY